MRSHLFKWLIPIPVVFMGFWMHAQSYQYDEISSFKDGYAKVRKDGYYGLINKSGEELIPPIYDHLGDLEGNQVLFHRDQRQTAYHKQDSALRFPRSYTNIYEEKQGLVRVQDKQGFNLIDLKGRELSSTWLKDCHSPSEGLVAVKNAEGWGFWDTTGKVVIPHLFEKVHSFEKGVAIVKRGKLWYLIDKTGNFLGKGGYKFLWPFADGLASATLPNGKSGYINRSGEVAIPFQYKVGYTFKDGLAPACKRYGRYGLIDTTGHWVIKPKYAKFYSGLAQKRMSFRRSLRNPKPFHVLQKDGKLGPIIPATSIRQREHGLMLITQGKKQGLLTREGNWLLKPGPYKIGYLSSHRILVCDTAGKNCGYMDIKGHWAISRQFESGRTFYRSFAIVEKEGLFQVIDTLGRVLFSSQQYLEYFDQGVAIYSNDSATGMIDTLGNVLAEGKYWCGFRVREHWQQVVEQEKWGFVNLEGKETQVWNVDKVFPFQNGCARAETWKGMGIIDSSGQWILPPVFDEVTNFNEGIACALTHNLYQYFNREGRLLFQIEGEEPGFFSDEFTFHEGWAPVLTQEGIIYIDSIVVDSVKQLPGIVLRTHYPYARGFYEGLAAVGFSPRRVGFIDQTGKEVIPVSILWGGNFKNGICWGAGSSLDHPGRAFNRQGKEIEIPYEE